MAYKHSQGKAGDTDAQFRILARQNPSPHPSPCTQQRGPNSFPNPCLQITSKIDSRSCGFVLLLSLNLSRYVGNIPNMTELGLPPINLEDGPQGVADALKNVTGWPSQLTVVG
jgi:hypothetical protein